MKNIIFTAIFALTSFGMAHAAEITMSDLDDLQRADVYILGETHDNALHHQGQVRVIKALKPKAVVFEMLTPQQAALITPDLLADETALEAALDWNASGWPDFAIYYPIFAALDGAKIYGAALPKTEVRRAYAEGAATVFGGDAVRFGLDQAVPEDQLDKRMQEQFDAHCAAMPIEMMGGMVEAQRIRDAAFADAVIKAYEDAGGPVVLIAGAGHAHYDWAVPAMLKKAGDKLSVISIAFLEEPAEPEKRYDFWIETERAIREDPCLAFQK
jgi:uncharacterized iron-regulated protein